MLFEYLFGRLPVWVPLRLPSGLPLFPFGVYLAGGGAWRMGVGLGFGEWGLAGGRVGQSFSLAMKSHARVSCPDVVPHASESQLSGIGFLNSDV